MEHITLYNSLDREHFEDMNFVIILLKKEKPVQLALEWGGGLKTETETTTYKIVR